MDAQALERAAAVAGEAADRARREILPRFRRVETETKADGSPVTEADRAAEQAIRAVLSEHTPEFGILGEEFGEDLKPGRPHWVVDPIDGTIAFSRGIPLFSTLIALVEDGTSVLGLIDLPALDERLVGWQGSGCRRNGHPAQVSEETRLERAIIAHGDVSCFDHAGQRPVWDRLASTQPMLRGYTDAFGHALTISGAVGAMVDFDLNEWDAAASRILVAEARGRCHVHEQDNGKVGLVLGSPALVEQLVDWLV
jgi:myo-inositol-1(or 4)-monophosphatase